MSIRKKQKPNTNAKNHQIDDNINIIIYNII